MNRFRNLVAVFAFSLLILGLPAIASAQFGNNRNDDYSCNDRDDDYGRNNRRNDDYYGRNNDYYGGYNNRALQSTIRNLKNDSRQFARQLDDALDRSRINGTDREDRLNELAKDFAKAADRLDSRFDNGRDLNRSENEARRVLELGSQVERALSRTRLNYDGGYWDRINQELRQVANAYNYTSNNRNNRNDRNNRNNRRGNGGWWNNIPF